MVLPNRKWKRRIMKAEFIHNEIWVTVKQQVNHMKVLDENAKKNLETHYR